MAKIVRYDGNLKAFASEQQTNERTVFGENTITDILTLQITPDYLRGFGIVGPSEYPTLQDFNAAMFTATQLMAYIHQMGIAEFNFLQEYHLTSVVTYAGEIYLSRANTNVNRQPDTNPAWWISMSDLTISKTPGRIIGVQTFGSGGVYTPTPGTKSIIVEGCGGGGGGGGAGATAAGVVSIGGGGASGGYFRTRLTSGFSGATVTIGSGGPGGINANPGGNGTATQFGNIFAAGGGGASFINPTSTYPTQAVGGNPGAFNNTGNILNGIGSAGLTAVASSNGNGVSGGGGASFFSQGGARVIGNSNGMPGYAGSGGSGAISQGSPTLAYNGGPGGNGFLIVTEFS